jgi:hypothetical protein
MRKPQGSHHQTKKALRTLSQCIISTFANNEDPLVPPKYHKENKKSDTPTEHIIVTRVSRTLSSYSHLHAERCPSTSPSFTGKRIRGEPIAVCSSVESSVVNSMQDSVIEECFMQAQINTVLHHSLAQSLPGVLQKQ